MCSWLVCMRSAKGWVGVSRVEARLGQGRVTLMLASYSKRRKRGKGKRERKKKEQNIVIVQSGTRKVVHESKAREDGGLCVTVGNVQGVCMHYLFPPP